MNRLFKGFIITSVSVAMIALAGCGPQTDEASSQDGQTPVAQEQADGQEDGQNSGAGMTTLEKLSDEDLAEMTGFDTDFETYRDSQPTRVGFMKKVDGDFKSESNVLVYTGSAEDSTALYVYEEEGSVVGAKLDEFAGSVNTDAVDHDYVFYNYAGMLEKQPTAESVNFSEESASDFEASLKESFVGEPLYKLNEKLDVYVPVYKYVKNESNISLNTYTIVSEVGYTASTDVNVIYDEEGNILDLYLDPSYGPEKKNPFEVLDNY